ncbi:MAG: aminopeptidase P family protein [Phycisphaerales bacterium]|nr:aminopeptidase P family protein [Phycisphaerales bacterium]
MPAAARAQTRRTSSATDVYAPRLKRLRKEMSRRGLDAILITNEPDIHYLTGFPGEDSYAFVTSRGRPTVISDFRFQEALGALKGSLTPHIRATSTRITQAARDVADETGARCIGIQAEHVTLATREALAKALGASRIKPEEDLLTELRLIKDDSEVRIIRKAVRIQQDALLATLPTIRPGQTEFEICARLEYEMKARGADGPSFHTIVAAQANGSLPHYRPGKKKTAAGRPLLIDWGARVGGYASDLTRTFSLGRWSPKMREIYTIVLDALEAGCAAVKPGRPCCEVDEVARSLIRDAGYGDAFGHSLGHGIGLDIHEGPRLAATCNIVLKPGMIVTVEPGIYLPGIGGVRIEDDVLVTDKGHKRLSSLPRDLQWATL